MAKFWKTLTWLAWLLFVIVAAINVAYIYVIATPDVEASWLVNLLGLNQVLIYIAVPVMFVLMVRNVLYSAGKRSLFGVSLERRVPKKDETVVESGNSDVV